MINFAIASQYSKALLNLSVSHEQMRKHLADLEGIVEAFTTTPKLKEFLLDPRPKNQEKKQVLRKLFEEKCEKKILHFLFFLVDKARLAYLPDILEGYRHLADQAIGLVEAQVTTAVPVNEENKERIRNKLEKALNKTVDVQFTVDPHIVGGMILMVGHQIIDNSVKRRLARLKDNLLAAKV